MRRDDAPASETPPFDAIAAEYDVQFTGTAVGRMQRSIVWDFLETWKNAQGKKTLRVLELNCGTGEDALWLTQLGCRVLATDVSPAMIALTGQKAKQAGLGDLIKTQLFDIQNFTLQEKQFPAQSFDLIFSNFGGLNCVPPESLRRLGAALPGWLKEDGQFIAVVMGRFCLWETIYFLWKGRFRTAFRRFSRQAVPARLDDRTNVDTWYYTPAELRALLQANGMERRKARSLQAVGFWLPPSYLNPFFGKHPRFLRFFFLLEQKCRGTAWASGADHFLLRIKKEDL